jgi:type I restriction-modification system DNA methylase subunit
MAIMNNSIEKKLWDSADALRTNSKLKSTEYATRFWGLIFLRFAIIVLGLHNQRLIKSLKAAGVSQQN